MSQQLDILVIWWVETCILAILFLHAFMDCACTLSCLFPRLFKNVYLATMYPSIFRDAINSEHSTLARIIVYWVAAMSLVRVFALIFQNAGFYMCVSVMYLLEGLVAEYEGFTSCTIPAATARLISSFSFCMSLVLVVLAGVTLYIITNPSSPP